MSTSRWATSSAVVGRYAARSAPPRSPWRDARSARHRRAADRLRPRRPGDQFHRRPRQALSLHGALGRGARDRRCEERRWSRPSAHRPNGVRRSRPGWPVGSARSSRSRRAYSAIKVDGKRPTRWRAPRVRPPGGAPGRHPPSWSWSICPTPTMPCSRLRAARRTYVRSLARDLAEGLGAGGGGGPPTPPKKPPVVLPAGPRPWVPFPTPPPGGAPPPGGWAPPPPAPPPPGGGG